MPLRFLIPAACIGLLCLPQPLAAQRVSEPVAGDSVPDTLSGLEVVDSLLATDTTDTLPPLSAEARREVDSLAVASLADSVGVAAAPTASQAVPVFIRGREVFRVHSGIGTYTPEERAALLSDRLTALSANREFEPASLRLLDGLSYTTIRLGETVVMSVTEGDAVARGMTRTQAAVAYLQAIRSEIERLRRQSTLRNVLINVGLSVLLLGVLIFALRGLGRFFRWIDLHVAEARHSRIRPVVLGTVEILSRDRIMRTGRIVTQVTRLAVSLLLIYLFLTTVFSLFPWTQSWSRQLFAYIIAPLRTFGRGFTDAMPNLIAIVVILVIFRWLIKASNFVFLQLEQGTLTVPGFYPEFAEPTRKIVRFLLIILAILLIYPQTPIARSEAFQGLTIFLGVLTALGSSTAVANVVAGLVLTYTRAFQVGDRIRVGETAGDVVEKTLLVTRVRTPKNEEVAVPNATMLSSQITNYSQMTRTGRGVVLHTTVTIGYDVPWKQVHTLLIAAAYATDGVEAEPAPFVLQTSLGNFSVAYEINAHTMRPSEMARIYSDLHAHIQDQFAEAGVEILSPAYEAQRDVTAPVLPARENRPKEQRRDGSPE